MKERKKERKKEAIEKEEHRKRKVPRCLNVAKYNLHGNWGWMRSLVVLSDWTRRSVLS